MAGNMQSKETSGVGEERNGHARKTKSGRTVRVRIVCGSPHPAHPPKCKWRCRCSSSDLSWYGRIELREVSHSDFDLLRHNEHKAQRT